MKAIDYEKIAEKLEKRGVTGHWDVETRAGIDPEDAKKWEPLDACVCQGCGKDVKPGFLRRIPVYCDECMACRNNEEDYKEVMKIVWATMENFVPLRGEYNVKIRWMRSRYGFWPVTIRGGRMRKAYISARCLVKRNALELHLVYAYMSLWMQENGPNGWNRARCLEYLDEKLKNDSLSRKKKCHLLIYWYMLCYLYRKRKYEEAERFRRIISRDEGIKEGLEKMIEEEQCYPYPLPEETDGKYLDRILSGHPAAEIGIT